MKKWFSVCVGFIKDVNINNIKPIIEITKNIMLRTGPAIFVV
jgi:hypothetical protein